jgi:acyl-homoserine lactone acylase PvdQ
MVEGQEDAEKFIIQTIQQSLQAIEYLIELFSPNLDFLKSYKESNSESSKIINLIRKIKPDNFFRVIKKLDNPWVKQLASNNWAVSGKIAKNGFPIFAADPHRKTKNLKKKN